MVVRTTAQKSSDHDTNQSSIHSRERNSYGLYAKESADAAVFLIPTVVIACEVVASVTYFFFSVFGCTLKPPLAATFL